LLQIACDEICKLYYPNHNLVVLHSEISRILRKVTLEYLDGTFKYPNRGIGLGYFETLKTLCVLSLLDHTNPIAIFGDQGLIPLDMKTRKTSHPGTVLGRFGFIFDKPTKTRILPYIETGVVIGNALLTPSVCYFKKSWIPQLVGALSCTYHWERKEALKSMTLPNEVNHIWKYISFQYEIAFGYEFFKGESLGHFDNLGVNLLAPVVVGNTSDLSVLRYRPPKLQFNSTMTRFGFAYKASLPISICKAFSRKRAKAYKERYSINTILYEYSSPKYKMNKTRIPKLSPSARATPSWMALRELLIHSRDIGKISYSLTDAHIERAISQYPFVEDPLEAKATGGITILSNFIGTFGTTTENYELSQVILNSDRLGDSSYIYRKDLNRFPPSSFWDGNLPVCDNPTRIVTQNPYLLDKVSSSFLGQTLDQGDSQLRESLLEQIKDISALSTECFATVDNWEVFDINTTHPPDLSDNDSLLDLYDTLDDSLEYRPSSPIQGEGELIWKT
jgi:hypothetical protein